MAQQNTDSGVDDRTEFMASVEVAHAQTLDEWAAERRSEGDLPTAERREAFRCRKRAREMLDRGRSQ